MLEFAFRPDAHGEKPLYQQLADYLTGLVDAGRVIPGERFPATRELSAELGLSRNTVARAYRLLVDAGVLASHVGQGTFVSARRLRAIDGGRPSEAPAAAAAARPLRGFAWDGLLSSRTSRLALPQGGSGLRSERPRFDFSGGRVDADSLPIGELRRVWSRAIESSAPLLAKPMSPLGLPALREEIALSLVARGITCDADDVLITNGVHQALDLVGRALIDPGDTVIVEQPGYFAASLAFRAHGARLVGAPVDEDGLVVDELARVLRVRRAKLVYVTPSAQSPTGAVLSERRREALLEVSDEYQLPIFEDDYDSELRFQSPPIAALKTRDPAGRVIYAGTFSKALFPALRVGYVVAPRSLLRRLATWRAVSDFSTDGVSQVAVLELMISGTLERHIRKQRRLYAKRRTAMLDALENCMPAGSKWTHPKGGHGVWVTLPPGVDGAALHLAAAAAGIAYARGDFYSFEGRFADSMALSFVNQSAEAIERGVAELAEMARALARTRVVQPDAS